jgi:hypothetical protein
MKKIIGFTILGFITLGLIGQLLIYTGIIPEKSAGPEVSIPTSTITPKPSIKPNIDPWSPPFYSTVIHFAPYWSPCPTIFEGFCL